MSQGLQSRAGMRVLFENVYGHMLRYACKVCGCLCIRIWFLNIYLGNKTYPEIVRGEDTAPGRHFILVPRIVVPTRIVHRTNISWNEKADIMIFFLFFLIRDIKIIYSIIYQIFIAFVFLSLKNKKVKTA